MKKELGNDTFFKDFALHIDMDKILTEFWLVNTLENSPGIIHGTIGSSSYHYNVPRGESYDGYFIGDLHIPVKIPFFKVKYHNYQTINVEVNNMETRDKEVEEVVEEKEEENNLTKPSKPVLFTMKDKDDVEVQFYYYDPDKHKIVKNPKKDLNLSRKCARYWTREREFYNQLIKEKIAPAVVIPPLAPKAKTEEVKEELKKTTDKPEISGLSLATVNKIKGKLGNLGANGIAELVLLGTIVQTGTILGTRKAENMFSVIQIPGELKAPEEVCFIAFSKATSANLFLEEMRKNERYATQFKGIGWLPASVISQTHADKPCLVIKNVKNVIEKLNPKPAS